MSKWYSRQWVRDTDGANSWKYALVESTSDTDRSTVQRSKLLQCEPESSQLPLLQGCGNWSFAESAYLMSLCAKFILKWPLIVDTYNFDGKRRPLEDIIHRFVRICSNPETLSFISDKINITFMPVTTHVPEQNRQDSHVGQDRVDDKRAKQTAINGHCNAHSELEHHWKFVPQSGGVSAKQLSFSLPDCYPTKHERSCRASLDKLYNLTDSERAEVFNTACEVQHTRAISYPLMNDWRRTHFFLNAENVLLLGSSAANVKKEREEKSEDEKDEAAQTVVAGEKKRSVPRDKRVEKVRGRDRHKESRRKLEARLARKRHKSTSERREKDRKRRKTARDKERRQSRSITTNSEKEEIVETQTVETPTVKTEVLQSPGGEGHHYIWESDKRLPAALQRMFDLPRGVWMRGARLQTARLQPTKVLTVLLELLEMPGGMEVNSQRTSDAFCELLFDIHRLISLQKYADYWLRRLGGQVG